MNKEPTLLQLHEGATISHNDKKYVIVKVADINLLLAKEVGSTHKVLIKVGDVSSPKPISDEPNADNLVEWDLVSVAEEYWDIAEQRLKLIEPLLHGKNHYSAALASKIAEEAGVNRATIYRWVANYNSTGKLSSLIPKTTQRGGKNKARILPEVEAIIKHAIETFHNTDQQPSINRTVSEIRRLCFNAGLAMPTGKTIKKRLDWADGRERLLRRKGEAAAYKRYDEDKGSIPDADWPLAMVQIDHTLLPIIIVDDIYRKSIRRVWITLAIDVNSRVCLGMYLSLDAPSGMSAGMCISHSILPKETWLNRLGITSVEWPIWGAMGVLHMDNAREFRGNMLRLACKEYDIDLHLRPVKKPRYGAHIERVMGTVSEGLKSLKGATFSGYTEKGQYDSEGNACMTFSEVEHWLVLFFARYHQDVHSTLKTSPLNKWREGLLGTKDKPGRGLPARRLDETALRINFTPSFERTIQNSGVVIDDIYYYHDVLRPWINTPDPEFPKHSRKFRFHRDPRNISIIYFYDEHAKRFFQIPYRNTGLPPVSIWELKEAHRKADERGISHDDERAIFAIINEQRELENSAAEKSKVARRAVQRRTQHEKSRADQKKDLSKVNPIAPSVNVPSIPGYYPDEVVLLSEE